MASSTQDEEFFFHRMVFNNDLCGVEKFLEYNEEVFSKENLVKDMHGNTPLHLAVMLGHHDIAKLLVQRGHGIHDRNHQGWTPLQESVSYGNLPTIESLLQDSGHANHGETVLNLPRIMEGFSKDIKLKFHWELTSWIPLASHMLPSDTCTVYCTKNAVRMDTTLEEFRNLRWVRGNLSRILECSDPANPEFLFLNNSTDCYYSVECSSVDAVESLTAGSLDELMEEEIIQTSLKMDQVKITPIKVGWLRRVNKTDQVGPFEAEVFKVSNVKFVTVRRHEHLEDFEHKKGASSNELEKPGTSSNKNDDVQGTSINEQYKLAIRGIKHDERSTSVDEELKSLPPPPKPKLTWSEYKKLKANHAIGRPRKEKRSSKIFEGEISMTQDFPLKLEFLLGILEVILPSSTKLYKRISEFVDVQLPVGFPVRINVPILPTVKATISILEFEYCDSLDQSLFTVPSSFERVSPD